MLAEKKIQMLRLPQQNIKKYQKMLAEKKIQMLRLPQQNIKK